MAEQSMEQRWLDLYLWKRIGAQGDGLAAYRDIAAHYAEPHRVYHTLAAHIEHCLNEFGPARHLAVNPDAVELALWLHDVIYEVGAEAKYNEEKSAALAIELIRNASLPDSFGQWVAYFILATQHDVRPVDPDAQLVADIDLSILGQPQDKFDEYERQVRKEYELVPITVFAARRSDILKSLRVRSAIYMTEFFRDKYEKQARRNIVRSLARYNRYLSL